MVYQLIYTSIATPALDDFTLREIAQSSSYNNQEVGVTGLLLFHDNSILQVLEGDEMSVYSLYGSIKRDKRHIDCKILSSRMGLKREFPNTFMGYKNISGRAGGHALFNLNRSKLSSITPNTPPLEAANSTQIFAQASGF